MQKGDDFMIRFHCEHCGHKISVQDEHAGKRCKCPRCDSVLIVPHKSAIVDFRCENCGQKLSVPEVHAGKKARCPKCKSAVIIPEARTAGAATAQDAAGDTESDSEAYVGDLTLLDVPQEAKAQSQPAEEVVLEDTAYEQLRRLQGGLVKQESDQIPQRRLPWVIDIFLYPASKPGLIMLGLIIVVPLFFKLLGKSLALAAFGFVPVLILAVLVIIVGYLVRVLIGLYFYWYFCECISTSAAGELRAPETIGRAPGFGEMLSRWLKTLVCLLVFFGPVLIRFQYNGMTDTVFWALLAYAVLLFPMALLAVLMFDSLWGLNPILLIGSIFSTFFQYCGLVLIFSGAGVLICRAMPKTQEALIQTFILRCACLYLVLVAAHLLGRFYWRCEEKLNWEV